MECNSTQRALAGVSRKPTGCWLVENEEAGGYPRVRRHFFFRRGAEMMSSLRHLEVKDYVPIIQIIDEWWGGRPMAGLLPRLFFEHFQPTSFVIEKHAESQGFLVGFRAQTTPNQAYIHFVGVHHGIRGKGIGSRLSED